MASTQRSQLAGFQAPRSEPEPMGSARCQPMPGGSGARLLEDAWGVRRAVRRIEFRLTSLVSHRPTGESASQLDVIFRERLVAPPGPSEAEVDPLGGITFLIAEVLPEASAIVGA